MGIPSPSSHSPGPKGIVTGPPELAAAAALASIPLLRSRHSVIVSSMAILVSSSTETSTERSRRTHSRSRRIHVHGSDQSIRITTSVSGTDWGVKSGLRRGAKDREGSDKRYAETRARVSFSKGRVSRAQNPTRIVVNLPSRSASRTSRYVYPSANWLAIGGVLPLRLSFTKLGSADVSAERVSRNSLWLSGVPPVVKKIHSNQLPFLDGEGRG